MQLLKLSDMKHAEKEAFLTWWLLWLNAIWLVLFPVGDTKQELLRHCNVCLVIKQHWKSRLRQWHSSL
uniref:Uncharacterized protein n=1 Tax=Rhizophora mucronata TaxID=61149 RepID=A0A2P2P902_RHIMU